MYGKGKNRPFLILVVAKSQAPGTFIHKCFFPKKIGFLIIHVISSFDDNYFRSQVKFVQDEKK